jgi:quercetin dioxygenase-like cupin family protein
MKNILKLATIAAVMATPALAQAHGEEQASRDVAETFTGEIPNIPGKSLTAVTVSYGPGGSSSAHRHPDSAFIWAYVIEGSIISQIEGQPPQTYEAGEYFIENPGDHHMVSQNASKTKPARLLAIFVLDTTEEQLVSPDK